MAATVASTWGLGVILCVAVLLVGMSTAGVARLVRRRRGRRRAREQARVQSDLFPEIPGHADEHPPVARSDEAHGWPADEAHGWPADEAAGAQPSRDHGVERPANWEKSSSEFAWAEPSSEFSADPPEQQLARAAPVAVRVQTVDGDPVDGALLTVAGLDGRQVARAEPAGDGHYLVDSLGDGSYVLIVKCAGFRPYARVVELGDELPTRTLIELCSDSGLAGTVRRKDGEPVGSATVTLKSDHGVAMTARTGAAGDYRITGVQPGTYTLLVTARVCRPVELTVDVPEHGLAHQDVELIGGAHVQGTVRVDSGRKVLPGTRVLLLDEGGEVLATTDADEQGRFRFSEVNAGEYTVCATPPSPAVSTVRIDGGLVHELDLELQQSG